MKQNLPANDERLRLIDENEQLRMQLEASLEENARVTEDRDRLLHRVTTMARELRSLPEVHDGRRERPDDPPSLIAFPDTEPGETEEELRVAFEELQAITEELENANSQLLQFNTQLEDRVAERTREIAEANAALRRSETALQAIADVVPDLLWRVDTDGYTEWVNHRWTDVTGKSVAKVVREGWLSVLHPDDRRKAEDAFAHSLVEGTGYQQEHRLLAKSGQYRSFLARVEPLRDDRGQIIQWYGAAMDMHDQRVGMDALEKSETRFRTLVEGMPQLVWRSANDGEWTWASPQWQAITGQSEDESRGKGWLDAFHPDDRKSILAAWAQAPEKASLEFEGRIYACAEARYRHFQTRATPVRSDSEAIVEWLGTSTDMDDILQLQNEQAILVSELQHRTRNLMAVVQAIIVKTLNKSPSIDDFKLRIEERMQALARVQNLLSNRTVGTRIAFDTLLKQELSAHVSLDELDNAHQISLTGPHGILLLSSTIQTFALALHELTTNAVKYGALSTGTGRLAISWDIVTPKDGGSCLKVTWVETGVSNVPHADNGVAARFGYGRELIERALPYQLGARTQYDFTEDGIECIIEVQLP